MHRCLFARILWNLPLLLLILLLPLPSSPPAAAATPTFKPSVTREPQGAVTRGPVDSKQLALLFTGDQFAESAIPILDALKSRHIEAAFFITGNFARNAAFRPAIQRMAAEGHYIGPHSDSHPLYCDWADRSKTLVTREFFSRDLNKNVVALRDAGGLRGGQAMLLVPPYEWYNAEQTEWAAEQDVAIINFTPGSGSNRDYARESDPRFVSSRRILEDVLAYERKDPHGLNGFLLLLHLGSGRKDPFHTQLPQLCDRLVERGYAFARVDKLLLQHAD